ncbi:MAG: hypothetical protein K0S12_2425 [Bacteroidetes bacterium]|jgi:hypothetical protein|nr:hypothetical protein [Bacteroidota bacterium]
MVKENTIRPAAQRQPTFVKKKKMKLNFPAIETITIREFAKLDIPAQCAILKQLGIFLESYTDKISLVKVYYVCGFFVEVIVSQPELEQIEIIPYRNGYKVDQYKHILFKSFKPNHSSLRKVA